jgi:hypothetical protein
MYGYERINIEKTLQVSEENLLVTEFGGKRQMTKNERTYISAIGSLQTEQHAPVLDL